jgi:ornithine cyclodeaminase
VIVISADQVFELLPMPAAIDAVRHGFELLAAGRVSQPPRQALDDGSVLLMMARVEDHDERVVKVISVTPANAERGLPTISATVILIDGATGATTALLDGAAVTALRTGAAAGVATDILASPGARSMAMLGAGAQAPSQIRAVVAVRGIEEVRVWSRAEARSRQLVARMATEFPDIAFKAGTIEQAIDRADIITCATRATTPLFDQRRLSGRVHINAMGAYRLDMVEIDPAIYGAAEIVAVDSIAAAREEAGDLVTALDRGLMSEDTIRLIGSIDGIRAEPLTGTTVFKSVGVAVQDWVTARAVSQAATASNSILAPR